MWLGAIWGIAEPGLLSLSPKCFLGPTEWTNNASEWGWGGGGVGLTGPNVEESADSGHGHIRRHSGGGNKLLAGGEWVIYFHFRWSTDLLGFVSLIQRHLHPNFYPSSYIIWLVSLVSAWVGCQRASWAEEADWTEPSVQQCNTGIVWTDGVLQEDLRLTLSTCEAWEVNLRSILQADGKNVLWVLFF